MKRMFAALIAAAAVAIFIGDAHAFFGKPPPPRPVGCWPGQTFWGFWCRNPNGTNEAPHQCFEGEALVGDVCTPPPPLCTVGQVQIGVQCINFPTHRLVIPINSCGFEAKVANSVLTINVLQCRE